MHNFYLFVITVTRIPCYHGNSITVQIYILFVNIGFQYLNFLTFKMSCLIKIVTSLCLLLLLHFLLH